MSVSAVRETHFFIITIYKGRNQLKATQTVGLSPSFTQKPSSDASQGQARTTRPPVPAVTGHRGQRRVPPAQRRRGGDAAVRSPRRKALPSPPSLGASRGRRERSLRQDAAADALSGAPGPVPAARPLGTFLPAPSEESCGSPHRPQPPQRRDD